MTKKLFGISWPTREELRTLENSIKGKDFIVYLVLGSLLIFSSLALVSKLNRTFLVTVPLYGGSFEEGVVGTPRFINPVLAISEPDKDLTNLVFSGLTRLDENSNPSLDLAESYSISENGLEYTFVLKPDAKFHDGEAITADDVVFTIEKISNPFIKSPKRASWEGVLVEKIDERTVKFTLKKAYAQFLDSTTIGIIPKHLWEDVSDQEFALSDMNEKAVGSGPYKISNIKEDDSGIPKTIELKSFNDYVNGKPFINKIGFTFYANENTLVRALKNGSVDNINSVSPENAYSLSEEGYNVESISIPRVFGLFFNQNKNPLLSNKTITQAMDLAIDKQSIVDKILFGYGTPLMGPRPIDIENMQSRDESMEQAIKLLEKAGYTLGEDGTRVKTTTSGKATKTERLSFSITTADLPELKDAAYEIRNDLSNIGISVDVRVYDVGTLNQDIIKERDYEILLFGELITSDADLFAFWHSSQRLYPGLNVAMYTNTNADALLEDLQTEDNEEKIKTLSDKISSTIKSDGAAIFLYSPSFIYIREDGVQEGKTKTILRNSSNRFDLVTTWYKNKDLVWKIFTK